MPSLRPHAPITDFTGGELSPRWLSRVRGGGIDPLQGGGAIAERYETGCETLTNGIVLPQGGIAKRQAFRFARDITDDMPEGTDISRLRVITFEAPQADYVTVWADRWVGVYNTGDLDVDNGLAAPVFTSATPYDSEKLCFIHFAQVQDAMVLFTCTWRPRVLRLTGAGWTFTDIADDPTYVAPLYDYSDANSPPRTTAKYEVSFVVTGNRNAYCSVSGIPLNAISTNRFTVVKDSPASTLTNFTSAMLKIASVIPSSVQVSYVGDGTTLEYEVEYQFLGAQGNGTGELIAALVNPGSGESSTCVAVDEGTSGAEMLWSGKVYVLVDGTYYRCKAPHVAVAADNFPGTGTNWTTFWESLGSSLPDDGNDWSVIESATWEENRAYYPGDRGWPGAGATHEQRLVASGPRQARGVLAGSRTGAGKFLDFTAGVNASDGFVFLLAAAQGATINWLHSQRFLFIGTSIGLFVQSAVPLTPTNALFSRQSNYTMSRIQGFDVAGEVFYIQRNGRQLRRAQYVDTLDSWQSTDMTAPIEHLFLRRPYYDTPDQLVMLDAAYQNSPDSVLWVLRNDGALLSLTYERYYGVAAWAKHTTRYGKPLALTAFFGGAAEGDMVMLAIKRGDRLTLEIIPETSRNEYRVVLNDEKEFHVEQVSSEDWPPYMDSADVAEGDGTSVIATPPRFEGREVDVVENGIYLGTFVPDGGQITLQHPTIDGSRIFVGFRYKTVIVPVKFEGFAAYTAQSQKVRWARPTLRLFASAMPTVNGQRLRERTQADNYDTATSLFTGDIELVNLGFDNRLEIVADLPLPFQISGIFGVMNMEDG